MNRKYSIFIAFLALLFVAVPLACAADVPHSPGTLSLSHVRIVRLSFVSGDVAVKRPDESEWMAASVNTPIEEGFSLATSAGSFAEVEFENGSTARIGQGSQMNFTQLALTQQGGKINKLDLSKGYATFHFMPERYDQYEVDASGVVLTTHGKAEFRTNLVSDSLQVEVFDGSVQAVRGSATSEMTKNHAVTFAAHADDAAALAGGIERDSWDKWVQARDRQTIAATNDESFSLNNNVYGWSDLDTYGDWSFFPGYGYGWAPYEPLGWSPYSAGMWGYYPGWGFTWISAEPWGWLPFHNGFWNYDATMGWFWVPGPLDAWNPALVDWYAGDGWIGWAPIGLGSGACAVATPGCITAVPPTAVQGGTPIRPTSPIVTHPVSKGSVTRISAPQLLPGASRPGTAITSQANVAATSDLHAAPGNVVMGSSVSPDSFLSHRGFLSGPQPIRAPLGKTMGGTFPTIAGHNGQLSPDPKFHPITPVGSAGAAAGSSAMHTQPMPIQARTPVVMAHGGAQSGGSMATFNRGGGIAPGGASASSSTGFSAAASPTSAGSNSAPSSPSSMPSGASSTNSVGAGRLGGGSNGGGNSTPAPGPGGGHR